MLMAWDLVPSLVLVHRGMSIGTQRGLPVASGKPLFAGGPLVAADREQEAEDLHADFWACSAVSEYWASTSRRAPTSVAVQVVVKAGGPVDGGGGTIGAGAGRGWEIARR